MRRPLFGNGVPQVIPVVQPLPIDASNIGATLTILDTRTNDDLNQRNLRLTLYAYMVLAPNPNSVLTISELRANQTVPTIIDQKVIAPIADGLGSGPFPVKILDNYIFRGPQRISISTSSIGSQIYVWGYFELEPSLEADPREFRPFTQNPALVPPFYAGVIQAPANSSVLLHVLEPGYTDEITLSVLTGEVGEFSAAATLGILGSGLLVNLGGGMVTFFDGIPFSAPPKATLVQRGFTIGTIDPSRIIGSFKR